jgi:hypothetical protein
MGLRPPKGDENGFCSATALHGSVSLPFVIPPAPVCRGTGVVMGLRPTQGDEKRLLSSNRSPWKRRPPLCHPACPGMPWDRSVHGPAAHPRG